MRTWNRVVLTRRRNTYLNKDYARVLINIMYIAWDTETTGLPRIRTTPSLTNLHNYDMCRIVSLAAVKYSSRGRELASFHRIVQPDGYRVEATEIHGITHDYAMEHGTPFARVFEEFMAFVGPVETLVAHNSQFDENVLTSELLRLGTPIPFEKFTFVCTNNMHKELEFTPIKLVDLYTKIFGHGFDGAHDALNDARACGEVYPRLRGVERVHKSLGIPKVVIKASDVSSIMGLSFFKRAPDVVEDMWRKYRPETCPMPLRERETLPPRRDGGGVFYTYDVCSIMGTSYQIMGRVERLRPNEDGTYTLVELKTRTKGLFRRLRDYEEVQCRVYLAMLPASVKDCLLVESYEGEMRSYRIERDLEKWKVIATRVHDFCSYFHHQLSVS